MKEIMAGHGESRNSRYVPCFFVVMAFLVAHLSQLTEWHTLGMCGSVATTP